MRKKTGDILLKLGITPDIKGFNYIIDLVEMINNDEVTKITVAYAVAGKKNGDSGSKVERAIRHAISKINITTKEFAEHIGANVVRANDGNITNSAFLYTLAYRVKEGLE